MSQFPVYTAEEVQQKFTLCEPGNKGKYPWDKLTIGQSFYVAPQYLTKNQQKAGLSVTPPEKYIKQGFKVVVRKITDNQGYIVTRVS